ncbi:MAG TPA: hypothetical protein VLL97_14950 [Acidobacteriota bacterium]|nr:hypothetical protein [Acidobacteriota bacterium]
MDWLGDNGEATISDFVAERHTLLYVNDIDGNRLWESDMMSLDLSQPVVVDLRSRNIEAPASHE